MHLARFLSFSSRSRGRRFLRSTARVSLLFVRSHVSFLPSYPHCASNAWTTARVVVSSSTSKIFMGCMFFFVCLSWMASAPSTTFVSVVHCMFQWSHHFVGVHEAWCRGTNPQVRSTVVPPSPTHSCHEAISPPYLSPSRSSPRRMDLHQQRRNHRHTRTTNFPSLSVPPILKNDPSIPNPPHTDGIQRGEGRRECFTWKYCIETVTIFLIDIFRKDRD